ncbi:mitochondrial ribosomal protein L35 [Ptiloglossa arizonensis]|uniref:mitochondrial ribosomal protein L35 n=1 Tax=Ptiloglossa arizonensis TaxID=3350558 RepID=UPI003F9FE450
MLRIVSTVVRGIVARTNFVGLTNSLIPKQYPLAHSVQQRYFGALSSVINSWNNVGSIESKAILSQIHAENVIPSSVLPVTIPTRTVTKFSLKKGKRKSVKTVLKRFYRLNWGMWIRTCAGHRSKRWRKSSNRRRRQKRHVFCNSTQCTLLDKMVTKYWKRPHYYVDDPYNPYHKRNEFPLTRRIPLP